jgi:hypothetical protein
LTILLHDKVSSFLQKKFWSVILPEVVVLAMLDQDQSKVSWLHKGMQPAQKTEVK